MCFESNETSDKVEHNYQVYRYGDFPADGSCIDRRLNLGLGLGLGLYTGWPKNNGTAYFR